ncbi:MAG: protein-L-isoaspartate O-methyltransferase [Candidatus Fermentibacteraceae bacterium]
MTGPDELSAFSVSVDSMLRTLRRYGIQGGPVMDAMARVPRHLFIPPEFRSTCDPYGDHPCPIGHGQTVSQPFIVAYMAGLLGLSPGMRVLEVGVGCGYLTAVLLEMGVAVFGIELIGFFAEHAARTLRSLGYSGYRIITGDGAAGWPGEESFHGILVSCAPRSVPEHLLKQLGDGGRMVIPVGPPDDQRLVIVDRRDGRAVQTRDIPVRFVPMVASP